MTGRTPAELPAGQPGDADGPVFAAAWEAQAFAMTHLLHERGLFTWTEWAAALSEEIRAGGGDAADYYHHWLKALERLVVEKRLTSAEALHDTAHAWEEAARATPHGQPIMLARGPGASSRT